MSRITDTERGARIASDMAAARIMQPDLFGDALSLDFWEAVYDAAEDQLIECMALRAVFPAATSKAIAGQRA